MDARDCINRLGRKRVIEALGVSTAQISNKIADGEFPGYWFDPMDRIAESDGWELPRDLFSWRKPIAADSPREDAA